MSRGLYPVTGKVVPPGESRMVHGKVLGKDRYGKAAKGTAMGYIKGKDKGIQ